MSVKKEAEMFVSRALEKILADKDIKNEFGVAVKNEEVVRICVVFRSENMYEIIYNVYNSF